MELKQEKSEELIKYIEHLKEKYFNYNEIIN
jgi:ribosomal protein L29